MKHYVIYEIASGEIQFGYTGDESGVQIQCGDGQSYAEGKESSLTHYVSEGTLIAYTEEQKQAKCQFKGAGWAWSNTTMSWQVTDAAMANEFALIMLRIKRDELLAQSDYTQMPDVPLSNKDLWDNYRQALRDLPQTYANITSLDEVTWPTPPQ